MGNIILSQFGFGVESTFGTPVAATRFVPCTVTVDPMIENYAPVYYRGSYEAPYEAAQGGKIANWDANLDCRQADLPIFLESLVGPSNPTAATFDTSGRRRTYATSNTGTRKYLSMEQNDSDVNWVLTSMSATSIAISGNETDAVKVNVKGFGLDYDDLASAATYVNEVKTPLMSWQRIFSVDAAAGTPGATAVDSRLVNFSFGLANGSQAIYNKNNSQNYGQVAQTGFTPSLSLTLLTSADRYLYSEYKAGTRKIFGIELRGPLVSAAYEGVKMFVCGKIATWKQATVKGRNAVAMTIQPIVDTTVGYSAALVVANQETAV